MLSEVIFREKIGIADLFGLNLLELVAVKHVHDYLIRFDLKHLLSHRPEFLIENLP
jgi:hypothetical protein